MAIRKSVPPTPAEAEEDKRALKKVIHGRSIVDASAMTGAVTGAIVGLAGGPPGVIGGGVLGAAAGIIAGKVLDDQAKHRHARDSQLDEEIGVTSGEIGLGDAPVPQPPPSAAERHVAALEKELEGDGDSDATEDEITARRKPPAS